MKSTTKVGEIHYVIDVSIKEVFAEQEGLSDFIDKKIEKQSNIQCASCARNGIITNYQKAKQKCDICNNLLTKKK